MSGRVIVVGSVNVDLVARGERLPAPGETVTGATFGRHHGGKGGNQAVAAARLGATVAFVGAVGDDDLGAEARAALVAEGVDVGALATVPGPTGVALILVDGRGENLISVASGANTTLNPAAVHAALAGLAPGPSDVVLIGHEIATAVVRTALRTARATGARTIFNPAPATGLDRTTFGEADVLTPNRTELAALVAEDARRIGRPIGAAADATGPAGSARTLLRPNSEGPGVREAVIVTLGAVGAVVVGPSLPPLDLAAPRVAAVDAVGAGDAFNGALAAGLVAGLPLVDAARRAVVAASISTTRPGAREGMPNAAELEQALAGGAAGPTRG